MPPRLNLFASSRRKAAASLLRLQGTPSSTYSTTSSSRAATLSLLNNNTSSRIRQRRGYSTPGSGSGSGSDSLPRKGVEGETVGPNQDPGIPDVGSEAAEIDRIVNKGGKPGSCGNEKGDGSPEYEQGTPVQEILKRDEQARKNAPKVMRDQVSGSGSGSGSRSYSTSARLGQQQQQGNVDSRTDPLVATVADMMYNPQPSASAAMLPPGYKFEPPTMPIPRTENAKRRYDPLVEQFTKLLMRDGKLSRAQKTMESILDTLRLSPPPTMSPTRPLLTTLPSPQLPLNPILYLTLIVDSVAPLLKIRQQKGAAGGGMSLQIPVPLPERRRRRTAIKWILDASEKRKDSKLANRVAGELLAVAEGKGAAWEKRANVHKMGISARTNIKWMARR
ncbi:hypothetical protein FQN54_005648 [Arachnomyces sp. PD_36]|nr:hypothetical protein FQN54_005648 [Arachnomyces sp. PD_36]